MTRASGGPGRRALLGALLLVPLVPGTARGQLRDGGLIGQWQGVMITPFGTGMQTEAIFMPNGDYSIASRMGTLATRHWGRYEIVENWIHFRLHGAEPREYCAHLGCTRLAWPRSETWHVTRFDGRVLETVNGRLVRVR